MEPAEALARKFHEAYERLAPQFSYKTRKVSAVPWEEVPSSNKALMLAVAAEILAALTPSSSPEHEEAIARIIDSEAFDDTRRRGSWDGEEWISRRKVAALTKARSVLALPSPPPQEGWRPIETAPKDGTPVLLICASAYTPTAFEGWWAQDGQWGVKGDGWVHYALPEEKMSGGVRRWFPTHWMPKSDLPAPPRQDGGEL